MPSSACKNSGLTRQNARGSDEGGRMATRTPDVDDDSTERIVDIDVSTEMESSFLEYAYSVIYSRALPDARDGLKPCLLYTSDAADDLLCVDLGGRRIIKKKKKKKKKKNK